MFTFEKLLQVLEAEGINAPKKSDWVHPYPIVSTDSRDLQEGALFFALTGERFNAHLFLAEVEAQKACAAVVERTFLTQVLAQNLTMPLIVVDNTRQALGKLAQYWRTVCSDTCVIGVTGSNGKTTVKEMLAHCLNAFGVAFVSTQGNLNNEIGLPLMVLKLRPEHQYAVFEMGMNHAGELTYLSHIAQPDVAVITTVQQAHLGCFDNIEAIAHAKGEILSGIRPHGCAVLDPNSPHFMLWERLLGTRQLVPFAEKPNHFALSILGAHNQFNAKITYTILTHLGFSSDSICEHLQTFSGVKGRLQTHRITYRTIELMIIDDTYNANPDSMKAGLATLATLPNAIKIAILGDMAELGTHGAALHQQLGFYIADLQRIDYVFCVGELMQQTAVGARTASDEKIRVLDFDNFTEATTVLRLTIEHLVKTHTVQQVALFVKGSRSSKMERFVTFLLENFSL